MMAVDGARNTGANQERWRSDDDGGEVRSWDGRRLGVSTEKVSRYGAGTAGGWE